jgi:hypothetical protein
MPVQRHSAHQARTACFDTCAPKVTVLQSPTAQRRALRGTQCQWLIVDDTRIQKDQQQDGDDIARRPTGTEGRCPRRLGVTTAQLAHYERESEK